MYNDWLWNFLRSGNVRQPNSFFHCFKETLCTISIDMSSLNYLVRKYFKQVYAWTQFFLGICFGSLSSVFQNVCSLYSSSFLEKHFSQFWTRLLSIQQLSLVLVKTLNVHQACRKALLTQRCELNGYLTFSNLRWVKFVWKLFARFSASACGSQFTLLVELVQGKGSFQSNPRVRRHIFRVKCKCML